MFSLFIPPWFFFRVGVLLAISGDLFSQGQKKYPGAYKTHAYLTREQKNATPLQHRRIKLFMTETTGLLPHMEKSKKLHPFHNSGVPDRILHLHVQRIYEPGPETLDSLYRGLAGIYAITVPGDLRSRMTNCALDGFHAKFDPRCLRAFTLCVIDPDTNRTLMRDRRTPWDSLGERCKNITIIKQFINCAPGFVVEDVSVVANAGERPVRFDPAVRVLHLRVALAAASCLDSMSIGDQSVPGVYCVTLPVDLPENQHASCVLDAFHSHVPIDCLDGFDFAVTDPATGAIRQRDERRTRYTLGHRCLGLHRL